MTKAGAIDLLGDLLGIAPTDNTNLFGEEKPKAAAKPRPQWKLRGLVLLYKTTVCSCCGTQHTEVNPLVMAKEVLEDADGNVVKEQTTSDPTLLHSVGFELSDLPITTSTMDMRPVPFCSECVESVAATDLRKLFNLQKRDQIIESAVKTATELSSLNEKRAKAESDLMELAAQWSNFGVSYDQE